MSIINSNDVDVNVLVEADIVDGQITKSKLSTDVQNKIYKPDVVTSGGADLAEVGFWVDDNPDNENRLYRFVSIAGETGKEIKIADASSQIVGTSNLITNVGFCGGYTEGDEDDNTKVIVSIVGVVPVKTNDNTIKANDRVMSDENGYAVKSTNNLGYRVLEVKEGGLLTIVVSPNTDMVQRIKTDMDGKQQKLTAGTNITIDNNNVISAAGGGSSQEIIDIDEKYTKTDFYQKNGTFIKNKVVVTGSSAYSTFYFLLDNINEFNFKVTLTNSSSNAYYGFVDLQELPTEKTIAEINEHIISDTINTLTFGTTITLTPPSNKCVFVISTDYRNNPIELNLTKKLVDKYINKIDKKLDKNLGVENAGKILGTDLNGNVIAKDSVNTDKSLSLENYPADAKEVGVRTNYNYNNLLDGNTKHALLSFLRDVSLTTNQGYILYNNLLEAFGRKINLDPNNFVTDYNKGVGNGGAAAGGTEGTLSHDLCRIVSQTYKWNVIDFKNKGYWDYENEYFKDCDLGTINFRYSTNYKDTASGKTDDLQTNGYLVMYGNKKLNYTGLRYALNGTQPTYNRSLLADWNKSSGNIPITKELVENLTSGINLTMPCFIADLDTSYIYWSSNDNSVLPQGICNGDIIWAGKSTPYYKKANMYEAISETIKDCSYSTNGIIIEKEHTHPIPTKASYLGQIAKGYSTSISGVFQSGLMTEDTIYQIVANSSNKSAWVIAFDRDTLKYKWFRQLPNPDSSTRMHFNGTDWFDVGNKFITITDNKIDIYDIADIDNITRNTIEFENATYSGLTMGGYNRDSKIIYGLRYVAEGTNTRKYTQIVPIQLVFDESGNPSSVVIQEDLIFTVNAKHIQDTSWASGNKIHILTDHTTGSTGNYDIFGIQTIDCDTQTDTYINIPLNEYEEAQSIMYNNGEFIIGKYANGGANLDYYKVVI